MSTKTQKRSSSHESLVESAVDAAEELGRAATAFKESWGHVKKARAKGHVATAAISRGVSRAARVTKTTVVRMLPHSKKTSKSKKRK